MSTNLPDFEKAEYVGQPPPPVAPAYAPYESQMVSGDVDTAGWDAERSEHERFVHALLYGFGAAILGSILYAAFTLITHIEIGYVAVGVGYLVGKAMLQATRGLGGRRYQIAAVAFTYFSVSLAAVPEILWYWHQQGHDIAHVSSRGIIFLAEYGIASPFLGLKEGIGGFIGLFILFVGMRAAWRFTADRRLVG
jgi:hypothetical protein